MFQQLIGKAPTDVDIICPRFHVKSVLVFDSLRFTQPTFIPLPVHLSYFDGGTCSSTPHFNPSHISYNGGYVQLLVSCYYVE